MNDKNELKDGLYIVVNGKVHPVTYVEWGYEGWATFENLKAIKRGDEVELFGGPGEPFDNEWEWVKK